MDFARLSQTVSQEIGVGIVIGGASIKNNHEFHELKNCRTSSSVGAAEELREEQMRRPLFFA